MRAMLAMMLVVAWVGTSSGGAIGLYSDSVGTNCSATLAVGGTIYVQVWIEPDAAFDAGEFRVDGMPSGWTSTVSLLDESIWFGVVGDLTGDGVHFDAYEARPGRFGLFYLKVYATSEEHNVVLQVMPHATPNPLPGTPAGCAWLHYGGPSDPPTPGVCVSGGRFTINGPGDCFVAVEPATWGQLRSFYR